MMRPISVPIYQIIMPKSSTIRVGIISDTHGYLDNRIVDVLTDCDMAVHAGDIMGIEILESMRAATETVIAIRGNNDIPALWHTDHHDALHELDDEAVINLPGGDVVVLHGHQHGPHPEHSVLRENYPYARLIIYGHSHKLVSDQDSAPWVANPGAAGQTRTHGGPSCLVLEASETGWNLDTLRFPD